MRLSAYLQKYPGATVVYLCKTTI